MSVFRSVLLLVAASSGYFTNAQPAIPASTVPNTTPTCTQPTGLANTYVPAPAFLGRSYQIKPAFDLAHRLFSIDNLPATLSEATVAIYCLEQCITYQTATKGPCLSFNVNYGKPVPPNNGPPQFYCTCYDAPVAND